MEYLKRALKIAGQSEQPMDRFMSRLDRIAIERSKPVVTRRTTA